MNENKRERKHYSPEQKVLILRELLENNVPISQLAAKYQVHPNDIYNWKKKLFEGAKDLFQSKPGNQKQSSIEQKKIEKLESKLRDRDEAIAMLLKETIEIKKSIDGEI